MLTLAIEEDAALVLVRHLKKADSDNAMYKGAGSIDVIGFARSALLIAIDPNDPSRRIAAHFKHNLSPRLESMVYRLVDGDDETPPRVKWEGTSPLTADELVSGTSRRKTTPRDRAKEFLRRELADGLRLSSEIEELAEKKGISKSTLKRAREELDINTGQTKDGWWMSLSENS